MSDQENWEAMKLREYEAKLEPKPEEYPDEYCRECKNKKCWECPVMG